MINLHGSAIRARIDEWRDAGLIDAATADSLRQHEAANRPGNMIGALGVIGAISVGLGMLAVVAGNWDEIPVWVRLGVHMAINLGLGIWGWRRAARDDAGSGAATGKTGNWGGDILTIILSASTLALIAHIGQSFQLQGDGFGLMVGWLALTTPFTFLHGRGWAVHWLWTAGLGVTTAIGLERYAELLLDHHLIGAAGGLTLTLCYAAPLVGRLWPGFVPWGGHFQRLALGGLVTIVSGAQFVWNASDLTSGNAPLFQREALIATAVMAVGLWAGRAALSRSFAVDRVQAFLVGSALFAALPFIIGGLDSSVATAAGFCLYWLVVAWLCNSLGLVIWYRLAVVLVALRLFGVYLEAWGGLLQTGGGLILSGAVLLALSYAVRRLLRKGEPA